MGEKPNDTGKTEPSLELPSLSVRGLRRRRKSRTERPAEQPPEEQEIRTQEPTAAAAPTDTQQAHPAKPSRATSHEPQDGPRRGSHADVDVPVPGRRAAARRGFSLPAVSAWPAAVITGLVVGALGTVLTYLGLEGCEALKGTSSCGGPGFFLLVGILALMVLVGTVLLKAWRVTDPGSTSFLAVGVLAVVVLVVLIDAVFSGWMFLLVPLVSAGGYALSHWVTTQFIEEQDDGREPHDVR
jgi:hypothetical protein